MAKKGRKPQPPAARPSSSAANPAPQPGANAVAARKETAHDQQTIEQVTRRAEPPKSTAPRQTSYGERDSQVPGVLPVGAILAGVVLAALFLMQVFLAYLGGRPLEWSVERDGTGAAAEPATDPRWHATAAQQLARLRSEEKAILTTYAWIDRPTGVVRIPIDRAIALVAARGLPVRTAPMGGGQ